MAKIPGTGAKRTRSAKAKRLYLLSGVEIQGEPTFARNGDDAMDAVDNAAKNGVKLFFKRVMLPAPAGKKSDVPAA
jgi:hypothetical protein